MANDFARFEFNSFRIKMFETIGTPWVIVPLSIKHYIAIYQFLPLHLPQPINSYVKKVQRTTEAQLSKSPKIKYLPLQKNGNVP